MNIKNNLIFKYVAEIENLAELNKNDFGKREFLVEKPLFEGLKSLNMVTISNVKSETYGYKEFIFFETGRRVARFLEKRLKFTATTLKDPLIGDFEPELKTVFGIEKYKIIEQWQSFESLTEIIEKCSNLESPEILIDYLKNWFIVK